MNGPGHSGEGKVVYLPRLPHAMRIARRSWPKRLGRALRLGLASAGVASALVLSVALRLAHLGLCALLALAEPLLRITLVPLALLGFVLTLVLGFVVGDPRFPRWAMLGVSVGLLVAYWLYLALLQWVTRWTRWTGWGRRWNPGGRRDRH